MRNIQQLGLLQVLIGIFQDRAEFLNGRYVQDRQGLHNDYITGLPVLSNLI